MNVERDITRLMPLTPEAIKPGKVLVIELRFPEHPLLTYAVIDEPKLSYEASDEAVLVTPGPHRYSFKPEDIISRNTGLINVRGVMSPEDRQKLIKEQQEKQKSEEQYAKYAEIITRMRAQQESDYASNSSSPITVSR